MRLKRCGKKIKSIILIMILFFVSRNFLNGQDTLLSILKDELQRQYNELKNEELPPYYIEYKANDITMISVASSFGSLTNSDENKARIANITVKIGDYGFDNTHIYQDEETASAYNYSFPALLPVENNSLAIRQVLWLYTNRAYLNALSVFSSVAGKKETQQKKQGNKLADFSKEVSSQYSEFPVEINKFQKKTWENRLKEITRQFLGDSNIINGDASFNYVIERKYLVTSEGTSLVQNVTYSQLYINTSIRNNEGNVVPMLKSYISTNPLDIPDQEEIMADVDKMLNKLRDFKTCPTAEPYTGPAILSPAAAGVFFHEIFGHRVEGHRLKDETDAQTFKEKIGSRVLPKTFNVYFDPQQVKFNNIDLIGHYKYDDEGVKSQKVRIIENGVLKTFLMSRTPVEGFSHSNGHGRAQTGQQPVARQSNMFVESSKPYSEEALRKMLIKACKSKGLKYGYYFKSVYGGFTFTTRFMPNVFNIFPLEVYRIYVDGRPDELVKGVELIGTPLAMFEDIEAAGDNYEVFNGFCGAESGLVPVSTIAPAIFVKKIETQSQPNQFINLPILKIPGNDESINTKND